MRCLFSLVFREGGGVSVAFIIINILSANKLDISESFKIFFVLITARASTERARGRKKIQIRFALKLLI